MAQAAKTPERSIDLVASVRRIFDEDDVDKSAQNHHRDSMGSGSDAAQPSYPPDARTRSGTRSRLAAGLPNRRRGRIGSVLPHSPGGWANEHA